MMVVHVCKWNLHLHLHNLPPVFDMPPLPPDHESPLAAQRSLQRCNYNDNDQRRQSFTYQHRLLRSRALVLEFVCRRHKRNMRICQDNEHSLLRPVFYFGMVRSRDESFAHLHIARLDLEPERQARHIWMSWHGYLC